MLSAQIYILWPEALQSWKLAIKTLVDEVGRELLWATVQCKREREGLGKREPLENIAEGHLYTWSCLYTLVCSALTAQGGVQRWAGPSSKRQKWTAPDRNEERQCAHFWMRCKTGSKRWDLYRLPVLIYYFWLSSACLLSSFKTKCFLFSFLLITSSLHLRNKCCL